MTTSIVGRNRLRAARVLFLALVGSTTATYLASGRSPFPATLLGFTWGGFSFVAVVLLYLVYLGARPALAQES